MKTSKHLLIGLGAIVLGMMPALADVTRTFTDSQGRKLEATFIKLEGETVYIQIPATGQTFALPLSRLSPEDQAAVKTLPPAANAAAMTSVATDAKAEEAAKKIDQLVLLGLQKQGLQPNPLMSDEQFVRRVYLDIAGRIPNYQETTEFIKSTASDKSARAKLIDKLLGARGEAPPDGYVSNMYNYFADMLRIKERGEGGANQVRGLSYIQWLKEQMHSNTAYDKMVHGMLTATGKVWENGATGYLLRDAGMPLDNLANTLSVFLGTDVACAQCHDHPFTNWTQRQFYEMASFFGATTTQLNRSYFGKDGDPEQRLRREVDEVLEQNGQDPKKLRNLIGNVIRANRFVVADLPENMTKLPMDYRYKDGKGGDPISPKLIHWSKEDAKNPAYLVAANVEKMSAVRKKVAKANPNQKQSKAAAEMNENLRETFADWLTHPQNPRFAMTIANRMWARAMGMGLSQSVKSIDNPDEAYNPPLLKHLASEMVRVKFDLREFLRIIYNTQTYQREATTEDLAMGAPYYFQGPILRRMTAEQAWDSYVTLVLGNADNVKNKEADLYGRSINMDLSNPKLDAKTVLLKVNAVQEMGRKLQARLGGSLSKATGKEMMMTEEDGADTAAMASASAGDDKIVVVGGMKMMRASELEQPAPAGHFLREFGQSDRLIIDGGVKSGSVPQVLMMMNGRAQELLTNKDSLIHKNIDAQKIPGDKVDAVFFSILNRKPTDREKTLAQKQIEAEGEGTAFSNIIWALVNTREFSFVQ